MSRKRKFLCFLFLTKPHLSLIKIDRLRTRYSTVSTTTMQLRTTPGNTGWFFKKLAFIGLAYANILQNKYRIVTIKSVMTTLWNMIAAHVIIF